MERKCVCCKQIFENRASDCCSTECFECKLDPNMICPDLKQLPMNIDKKLKEIEKRIEEIYVNDKSLVKNLVKK